MPRSVPCSNPSHMATCLSAGCDTRRRLADAAPDLCRTSTSATPARATRASMCPDTLRPTCSSDAASASCGCHSVRSAAPSCPSLPATGMTAADHASPLPLPTTTTTRSRPPACQPPHATGQAPSLSTTATTHSRPPACKSPALPAGGDDDRRNDCHRRYPSTAALPSWIATKSYYRPWGLYKHNPGFQ